MRRKIASSLLCMMMLCSVCSPAYADEENVTTTVATETTTEITTAKQESTTQMKEKTTKKSVHKKKDKEKKKVSDKKSKKEKNNKKAKKDQKAKEKNKKNKKKNESKSFVQTAPKEKRTYVIKKTQGQLEKLAKEKADAADQIKQYKKQKEQIQNKIQKIDQFYSSWTYGSFVGIHTMKSDTTSQTVANIPADQSIQKLALELKDAELLTAAKDYHYGLQDQKNILIMTNSLESFDIQPMIDQKKTDYESQTKDLNQKIRDSKTAIEVANHSIKLIEKKKSIVFDPMNLLKKSNLTKDKAKKILKDTALEDCSDYFIECEEKYGVNAIGIMAIAVHESAWGTSRRAQEDHNLTGYGVYSDSAKGINAPTKEDNLLMTAKLLKERYLVSNGSYYKGTSLMAINEHYCTSGDWAINVTNHAYTLMDRL